MSVYKIAICDDSKTDLAALQRQTELILNERGIDYVIEAFFSGDALLQAARNFPNRFDMILLDVLLGEANGVDVAAQLRKNGTSSTIVMITVSPDFAMQGYKVNAWRYLMKPVDTEELKDALLSDYQRSGRHHELVFRVGTAVRRVQAEDIYYIETNGRGVAVHLQNEVFDAPQGISEIEKSLPAGPLVRCHKSYIVNVEYIDNIKRYEATVRIRNHVPVGKAYYDAVKAALLKKLAEPE